jgi:hypothetical protein
MTYSAQCPDTIPAGSAALSVDLTEAIDQNMNYTLESVTAINATIILYKVLPDSGADPFGPSAEPFGEVSGKKLCILVPAGEKYYVEAWVEVTFSDDGGAGWMRLFTGTYGSQEEPIQPQSGQLVDAKVELLPVVY